MPKIMNRPASAVDRNGREYTTDQMKLIFANLYKGNAKVIRLIFPSLSMNNIIKRARFYGLNWRECQKWDEGEDDILRSYYPDYKELAKRLPHRKPFAIEARCRRINLTKKSYKEFSAEEDALLRSGEHPPGRNEKSIEKRCRRLGIRRTWIKSVAKIDPKELRRMIGEFVPRGYSEDRRQDAISMVQALCMEGKCSAKPDALRAAAKKAVTAVFKMHPDRGAPVSMDARLFDDGTATVGDRIDSEAFHF